MSETATRQRDALHRLVDELPDPEVATAARVLEALRATAEDPVLRTLMDAPEEDESLSEEGRAAVEEGMQDLRQGKVFPHKNVRRELLGGE